MENASKALLIAGAVLIVILLIGLGILIYSRSTGVVDTATGIADTQTIQAFNAQFTGYEGKQKGSSVKTLMSTIIANNSIYWNDGEDTEEKMIIPYYINSISSIGGGCQISYITTQISPKIETSKTYNVTFTSYMNGFIHGISITEQ